MATVESLTKTGIEQLFGIDCSLSEGLRKRFTQSLCKGIETWATCSDRGTFNDSSKLSIRFDDSRWSSLEI